MKNHLRELRITNYARLPARQELRNQSGFTLLELLVVIAIIAILAAVVITNLNSARSKANDSKVQTDVNALGQAVSVGTTTSASFATFDTAGDDAIATLEAAVVPGLIKKMPVHPLFTSNPTKVYHYKADDKAPEDGVLDYVIWGDLSTGDCFVVANGTSFTSLGCAAADTTL